MQEGNKPKVIPIFIGCANPEIILAVDSHIKATEAPIYELAVISPLIQEKLQEQFNMQTMRADINQDITAQQEDEAQRNRARESALSLKTLIDKLFVEGHNFDRADIKYAIEATKGKISVNQVAELVNFLSLHNFIQPVDLEEKPHKRKFVFTFTNEELRDATAQLQLALTAQIQSLQDQYDMLEGNRINYHNAMVLETTEVVTDDIKGGTYVEEPKKKRGRPKKDSSDTKENPTNEKKAKKK